MESDGRLPPRACPEGSAPFKLIKRILNHSINFAISASTPCFKRFSLPVLGTTDSSRPLNKKNMNAQASSLHPLGDGKCPKPTPIQIVGAPSRAGPCRRRCLTSTSKKTSKPKKTPNEFTSINRQTQWVKHRGICKKLKVMIKHYWLPGVFFAGFVNHSQLLGPNFTCDHVGFIHQIACLPLVFANQTSANSIKKIQFKGEVSWGRYKYNVRK